MKDEIEPLLEGDEQDQDSSDERVQRVAGKAQQGQRSSCFLGLRSSTITAIIVSSSLLSVLVLYSCFVSSWWARPDSLSTGEGSHWNGWHKTEKLFIFGDSYSDVRFHPESHSQPRPSNPIGNPDYPGSTSSNGPNWVDYLVTQYNRTFTEAYDLAYGGSTVSWDIIPCFPGALDFRHQVAEKFMPNYGNKTRASWDADNSLFAVFFGINDVHLSYDRRKENRSEPINESVLKVYAGLLDQLYHSGARNFLLVNVPPIDRSPGSKDVSAEHVAYAAAAAVDFNSRLAALSDDVRTNYPGATVFEFDTHGLFSRILDDPDASPVTAGVVKNTTDCCKAYKDGIEPQDAFVKECGVPVSGYFWLNELHPTFSVHEAMAESMEKVLAGDE